MDRYGLRRAIAPDMRFPLIAPRADFCQPFSLVRRSTLWIGGLKQLAKHDFRIAQDTNRRGIIFAEFSGINFNVDEPGRRDSVGETGKPRASRAIVETRADGQNDIGI